MKVEVLKMLEGSPQVYSVPLIWKRYLWIPGVDALQRWFDMVLEEVRTVEHRRARVVCLEVKP